MSDLSAPEEGAGNRKLAVLLAMAMFVLVVDTSLMNVSISAVVHDLAHDRQRRAVGDRTRGIGFRRVHPDQQQGRRPDRAQAGLRVGPPGICGWRLGDDACAEPDRDHHLLGDRRRARCVVVAPCDAVPHPWQFRRGGSHAGLCAGRRVGCDRRRSRTTARRLRHHVPVVAGRLSARGRRHRLGPLRHQAREGCGVHRPAADRPGRRRAIRAGDGRRRPRHPRLAGRRRLRRAAHGRRRDRARALAYWLVRRKREGS